MGSNAKKTKCIRARKTKPNKRNEKTNNERVKKNAQILRDLAADKE